MTWTRSSIIGLGLAVAVAVGAVIVLQPKPKVPNLPPKPLIMNPVEKHQVPLYFSQNRGSEIVTSPVYREIPKTLQGNPQGVLKFATEALLKGPTEAEVAKGFFSEIPASTKLQGLTETPKAFTIDLSTAYTEGGGANTMTQRVKQLAKTLASVPLKKPVYVTVNGQSLTVLGGEGLSVTEPITQDPSVAQ